MNGVDLAIRARQGRPHLKVLLMTGHTDAAVLARLKALPEFSLLQKPFTPEALCLEVHAALYGTVLPGPQSPDERV